MSLPITERWIDRSLLRRTTKDRLIGGIEAKPLDQLEQLEITRTILKRMGFLDYFRIETIHEVHPAHPLSLLESKTHFLDVYSPNHAKPKLRISAKAGDT